MTPRGEDTTWRRIGYVYGGDKRCGGHEGQDVMMMRDMQVTEVVEEDAMDMMTW